MANVKEMPLNPNNRLEKIELKVDKNTEEILAMKIHQDYSIDNIKDLKKAVENLTKVMNDFSILLTKNNVITDNNGKQVSWLKANWEKVVIGILMMVIGNLIN